MGCNLSTPTKNPASTLLEIAPDRPGAQQAIPELDRTTLLQALSRVAKYLHSKKANITIICVGGAVNTIFLQSRTSTHDVDFFNQALTKDQLQLLIAAARDAQSRIKVLQNEWINNRTILFIPRDKQRSLTEEAIRQNEVIFDEPGLKVLAAPWLYACCAKIDRVVGSSAGTALSDAQPYDVPDAAGYLHRYLELNRRNIIARTDIEAESARFGMRVSPQVLQAVENEFRTRYGKRGIELGR